MASDTPAREQTLEPAGAAAAKPGSSQPWGAVLPQLAALQAGRSPGVERTADASELVIGRGIKVKGQIGSCRTLVVEGELDASIEVQALQVLAGGRFKGAATVENAELTGRFDGRLTVRERLRLGPGAQVSGKIRYRRIVIEEGGEISGDVAALSREEQPRRAGKKAAPAKPAEKKI